MTTCLTVRKETSRIGNHRQHLSQRAAVRVLPIALLAVFAVFSLIAPPHANAAGNKVTVEIANFTFSPKVVTVTPGTTVTWVNHDDVPHTATATKKAFHSKPLDTDDSYTFTFTTPGDYAYFCLLHPHMTGKVIVKAAAG